jgi:hypothetical protein
MCNYKVWLTSFGLCLHMHYSVHIFKERYIYAGKQIHTCGYKVGKRVYTCSMCVLNIRVYVFNYTTYYMYPWEDYESGIYKLLFLKFFIDVAIKLLLAYTRKGIHGLTYYACNAHVVGLLMQVYLSGVTLLTLQLINIKSYEMHNDKTRVYKAVTFCGVSQRTTCVMLRTKKMCT